MNGGINDEVPWIYLYEHNFLIRYAVESLSVFKIEIALKLKARRIHNQTNN